MKKKYIIEIVIAALLVLAELIVILCTYSEALHAPNTDIFITSIIAIFTNIEVVYGIGGTCYKNQNGIREAVNLLLTKQFLEIFSGSPVDYVFFGNLGDDSLTVCDKSIVNDNPSKYMNLLTTDFIVFSAMPQFNYFACIK